MSTFKDLKKNRKASLEKLKQKVNSMNTSYSNTDSDERFWYPDVDKVGNGSALVRFLPGTSNDEDPFVRIFQHSFKGPTGQWLIENCPTTIGGSCPVCDYNSKLWDTGSEDKKNIAREQKRRVSYVCNVYVISDPAHPENEGKVFLFRYGKVLFDFQNDKMNPQFEDEEPINPFDLWGGANFRIKITRKDQYRNYSKSSFDSESPLFDSDDKIQEVWESQYSLSEFTNEDQFKSAEKIQERLNKVVGVQSAHRSKVSEAVEIAENLPDVNNEFVNPLDENVVSESSDDEFFKDLQKLANEA